MNIGNDFFEELKYRLEYFINILVDYVISNRHIIPD